MKIKICGLLILPWTGEQLLVGGGDLANLQFGKWTRKFWGHLASCCPKLNETVLGRFLCQ